jgi:hypothetical protein
MVLWHVRNYLWVTQYHIPEELNLQTVWRLWYLVTCIQQNSFNVISIDSEILIIWYLRKVVQRPEVLLFIKKKNIMNETGRARDMLNKTGSVHTRELWGTFMQPWLQWKSNKCYIIWVCICSLRYLPCNAHVPYCYLWPAQL